MIHGDEINLNLQEVTAAAKPNVRDAESLELEELLAKYGNIFANGQ
jgi:hypothetical protein